MTLRVYLFSNILTKEATIQKTSLVDDKTNIAYLEKIKNFEIKDVKYI